MSSELHKNILNKDRLLVTKKDLDKTSEIILTKYKDRYGSPTFFEGILGEVMYSKKRNNDVIQPERGGELDFKGVDFIENDKYIDLKCPLIKNGYVRIFMGSAENYFKETDLYALSILLKEDDKAYYIEVGRIEPKGVFTELPYIVKDNERLRYIMINSQFKRFSKYLIREN